MGPSSTCFGQRLTRLKTKIGQELETEFGPSSTKFGLKSAKVGRSSAKFGSKQTNFGPKSIKSGPKLNRHRRPKSAASPEVAPASFRNDHWPTRGARRDATASAPSARADARACATTTSLPRACGQLAGAALGQARRAPETVERVVLLGLHAGAHTRRGCGSGAAGRGRGALGPARVSGGGGSPRGQELPGLGPRARADEPLIGNVGCMRCRTERSLRHAVVVCVIYFFLSLSLSLFDVPMSPRLPGVRHLPENQTFRVSVAAGAWE